MTSAPAAEHRDAGGVRNAMALDIAMGGSTNTILHLLAAAHEAGVEFGLDEIDEMSRRVPCLAKVAPNVAERQDLLHGGCAPSRRDPGAARGAPPRRAARRERAHGALADARRVARRVGRARREGLRRGVRSSGTQPRAACARRPRSRSPSAGRDLDLDQANGCIHSVWSTHTRRTAVSPYFAATSRSTARS